MNNGLTFMLDGGTHNDPFNGLGLPLPFPDALQEFKVETSAVPAQYGQHSAGAVNAVTKSGTNNFHGDLFEFVRNGSLNARNAFAVKRGLAETQPVRRNGRGTGCPKQTLLLRRLSGHKQRSEPSELFAYIPTPAMLAGDWTAIASPACNGGRQITLRAPFVNNRIDPALYATASSERDENSSDNNRSMRPNPVWSKDQQRRDTYTSERWTISGAQKHSLFTRYQYNRLLHPPTMMASTPISMTEADYTRISPIGDCRRYLFDQREHGQHFSRNNASNINNKTFDQDIGTWGGLGREELVRLPRSCKDSRCSRSTVGFTIGSAPGMPGFGNSTVGQVSEDISTTTGRPPDWVRSKLHLFEAVHIVPRPQLPANELQRHEHRNGARRFHDWTIEYIQQQAITRGIRASRTTASTCRTPGR